MDTVIVVMREKPSSQFRPLLQPLSRQLMVISVSLSMFHQVAVDRVALIVAEDWTLVPLMNHPHKRFRSIPVVALGSAHDEIKALVAGCNDYLVKPYAPTALRELVSRYLEPQQGMEALPALAT
jgi:CheY-like chemotaxis protein